MVGIVAPKVVSGSARVGDSSDGGCGWGMTQVVGMMMAYFTASNLCFPNLSCLAFRRATLNVVSGGGVLMASDLVFTVVTVVSHEDFVAMGPTVSVGIQPCFPFGLVEWLAASASGGTWCATAAKFENERCIGGDGLLQLLSEEFVCCRKLLIAGCELQDNVPII